MQYIEKQKKHNITGPLAYELLYAGYTGLDWRTRIVSNIVPNKIDSYPGPIESGSSKKTIDVGMFIKVIVSKVCIHSVPKM